LSLCIAKGQAQSSISSFQSESRTCSAGRGVWHFTTVGKYAKSSERASGLWHGACGYKLRGDSGSKRRNVFSENFRVGIVCVIRNLTKHRWWYWTSIRPRNECPSLELGGTTTVERPTAKPWWWYNLFVVVWPRVNVHHFPWS
jgi:hypothetical protein